MIDIIVACFLGFTSVGIVAGLFIRAAYLDYVEPHMRRGSSLVDATTSNKSE